MARLLAKRFRELNPQIGGVLTDDEIVKRVAKTEEGRAFGGQFPEFNERLVQIQREARPGFIDEMGSRLRAGFQSSLGLGAGTLGVAGEATGLEGVEEFGFEAARSQFEKAEKSRQEAGTIAREDIGVGGDTLDVIEDSVRWALGEVAEQVPNIAAIAVSALASGGLATATGAAGRTLVKKRLGKSIGNELKKRVRNGELKGLAGDLRNDKIKSISSDIINRKLRSIGQQGGAFAASSILNSGEIAIKLRENPNITTEERIFGTIAGGSVAALLDMLTPLALIGKSALSNTSRKELGGLFTKHFAGFAERNPKSAAFLKKFATTPGAAVTEGATEGLQEFVAYVTEVGLDEAQTVDLEEFWSGVGDVIASGAVVGGLLDLVMPGRKNFKSEAEFKRARGEETEEGRRRESILKAHQRKPEAERKVDYGKILSEEMKKKYDRILDKVRGGESLSQEDVKEIAEIIESVESGDLQLSEEDKRTEKFKLLYEIYDQEGYRTVDVLKAKIEKGETLSEEEAQELKLLLARYPERAAEFRQLKGPVAQKIVEEVDQLEKTLNETENVNLENFQELQEKLGQNDPQEVKEELENLPVAVPIADLPVAVPIADLPVAQPVEDLPVATPIDDLPVATPIADLPVAVPIADLPVAQPVEPTRPSAIEEVEPAGPIVPSATEEAAPTVEEPAAEPATLPSLSGRSSAETLSPAKSGKTSSDLLVVTQLPNGKVVVRSVIKTGNKVKVSNISKEKTATEVGKRLADARSGKVGVTATTAKKRMKSGDPEAIALFNQFKDPAVESPADTVPSSVKEADRKGTRVEFLKTSAPVNVGTIVFDSIEDYQASVDSSLVQEVDLETEVRQLIESGGSIPQDILTRMSAMGSRGALLAEVVQEIANIATLKSEAEFVEADFLHAFLKVPALVKGGDPRPTQIVGDVYLKTLRQAAATQDPMSFITKKGQTVLGQLITEDQLNEVLSISNVEQRRQRINEILDKLSKERSTKINNVATHGKKKGSLASQIANRPTLSVDEEADAVERKISGERGVDPERRRPEAEDIATTNQGTLGLLLEMEDILDFVEIARDDRAETLTPYNFLELMTNEGVAVHVFLSKFINSTGVVNEGDTLLQEIERFIDVARREESFTGAVGAILNEIGRGSEEFSLAARREEVVGGVEELPREGTSSGTPEVTGGDAKDVGTATKPGPKDNSGTSQDVSVQSNLSRVKGLGLSEPQLNIIKALLELFGADFLIYDASPTVPEVWKDSEVTTAHAGAYDGGLAWLNVSGDVPSDSVHRFGTLVHETAHAYQDQTLKLEQLMEIYNQLPQSAKNQSIKLYTATIENPAVANQTALELSKDPELAAKEWYVQEFSAVLENILNIRLDDAPTTAVLEAQQNLRNLILEQLDISGLSQLRTDFKRGDRVSVMDSQLSTDPLTGTITKDKDADGVYTIRLDKPIKVNKKNHRAVRVDATRLAASTPKPSNETQTAGQQSTNAGSSSNNPADLQSIYNKAKEAEKNFTQDEQISGSGMSNYFQNNPDQVLPGVPVDLMASLVESSPNVNAFVQTASQIKMSSPSDAAIAGRTFSQEQKDRAFESAKRIHGTTANIEDAGYILPDGTMLDFQRSSEDPRAHGDISFDGQPSTRGDALAAQEMFMAMGAIRVDVPRASLTIPQQKLTPAQVSKVESFLRFTDGEALVDVVNELLEDVQSFVFPFGTKTKRVVNLLKRAASGEDVNVSERVSRTLKSVESANQSSQFESRGLTESESEDFRRIVTSLQEAGVDVRLIEALPGMENGQFVTMNNEQRMIWVGMQNLLAPNTRNMRVLLHEAGHFVLGMSDKRYIAAADAFAAEMVGNDASNANIADPEEALVEGMAKHLQDEGFGANSRGIASAIFRAMRNFWMQLSLSVQRALLGAEHVNPSLAFKFYENRLRMLLNGDQNLLPSWITQLGKGLPTVDQQFKTFNPTGNGVDIAVNRGDAWTFPNAVPENADAVRYNIDNSSRGEAKVSPTPANGRSTEAPGSQAIIEMDREESRVARDYAVSTELLELATTLARQLGPKGIPVEQAVTKWLDNLRLSGVLGAVEAAGAEISQRGMQPVRLGDGTMSDANEMAATQSLVSALNKIVRNLARNSAKRADLVDAAKAKVKKSQEETAQLLKDPANLELHNAKIKKELKTLLRQLDQEKGVAYRKDEISQVIEEIESQLNNATNDIPQVYYNQLQQLSSTNTNITDLFEALSVLDVDWTKLSAKDALDKIDNFSVDSGFKNLNASQQKRFGASLTQMKNDKTLKAVAVAFAKGNSQQLALLSMRHQKELGRFQELENAINEIRTATDKDLDRIEKELSQLPAKAVAKDRLRQKILAKVRQEKKLNRWIDQREREAAIAESALPALHTMLDQWRSQLGEFSDFEAKPGAVFVKMIPEEGTTITDAKNKGRTYKIEYGNADSDKARHEAIADNVEWMKLNADRKNSSEFMQVKHMTEKLQHTNLNREQASVNISMMTVAIRSLGERFAKLGITAGKEVSKRLKNFQVAFETYRAQTEAFC